MDIEASWSNQYDFCIAAFKLYAELQQITGIQTFQCEILLPRAKTNIEKAEIYFFLRRQFEAKVFLFIYLLFL